MTYNMTSLIDIDRQNVTPDHIKVAEMTVRNFTIFLDDDIGAPSQYRDVIDILLNCAEHDSVNFVINSTGGRLDAAQALIEAIQACSGSVIANVVGPAYSAASMIACMCPECYITDSAEFMVHTGHYGSMGTVPNVKSQTEFVTTQTNKLLDKIYKGFLTEKELQGLKNGVEYWFDADEARKRMQRRVKYLEKEFMNGNTAEDTSDVQSRRKRTKAKSVTEDQAGRHGNDPAKDS